MDFCPDRQSAALLHDDDVTHLVKWALMHEIGFP